MIRWSFIFALGCSLAQAEVRYTHSDHLGSASVVTDASGAVIQIETYTPFGEILTPHLSSSPQRGEERGEGVTTYLYTGQELDRATELYYYGARYYDPAIARFLSIDPARESLNLYGYVQYNPILFKDPDGRKMRFANPEAEQRWKEIEGAVLPEIREVLDANNVILRTVPTESMFVMTSQGPGLILGKTFSPKDRAEEIRGKLELRLEGLSGNLWIQSALKRSLKVGLDVWEKFAYPEIRLSRDFYLDVLIHEAGHLSQKYGEAGSFAAQLNYLSELIGSCNRSPCEREVSENLYRRIDEILIDVRGYYRELGADGYFGGTHLEFRDKMEPFLKEETPTDASTGAFLESNIEWGRYVLMTRFGAKDSSTPCGAISCK